MKRAFLLAVAALAAWTLWHAPEGRATTPEPGIFADFDTSLGQFTCRLEHKLAPTATANFIGLAAGDQTWLDEPTGRARTDPFFSGLTFHRVIPDFMIQGGSRNGQGTDGPGYVFRDEFDPSLRHDGPGVLSMANAGPNSNGAQFFVTVADTAWLDDVHTIFGHVVSGQEVVDAISKVATDANNKPLTNVVLRNVAIRRVGPDAEAFDIRAQHLPFVSNVHLEIARAAGNVTLAYSNQLYVAQWLYTSSNLNTWTNSNLGIESTLPLSHILTQTNASPAQFFTLARAQYLSPTFSPRTLHHRQLTLELDDGSGTITIVFDPAGGGTYTYNLGNPGTVSSYTWYQQPFRAYIWPIEFSDLPPMTMRLDFTSDTAGTFSGTAYTPFAVDVTGPFTLVPVGP